MEITIRCNDLKELNTVIDQLCVLLPEKGKRREHADKRDGGGGVAPAGKKRNDNSGLHERIIDLRKKGMTAKEIALAAKCSEATVYNHLKQARERGNGKHQNQSA